MSFIIGIDVGGTFTDVVVAAPDGATTLAKAATTPEDQSEGVLEGLRLAAGALGLSRAALLGAASRIVHGTTAATNALLEGKAARVGLLTTEGHRDILEMREGLKPDRYNLRLPPPAPLVARPLRLGVRERLRADGSVEIPLDPASLGGGIDALAAAGVQAVAVCFLHAWRNPAHEQAAAAAVRARLPDAYVTTSAEVLPQIKEFERFSTTVANAAVGPVIGAYLRRLERRLAEAGYGGPLFVILSHGGVATVEDVDRSLRNDVGYWITFAGPFRYMDLMGVPAYKTVMTDLLPDLDCAKKVPSLMRKVVGSGGKGVSTRRGFYRYTSRQAKRWQELFLKFNYDIRKLAMKYPEDAGDRPASTRSK